MLKTFLDWCGAIIIAAVLFIGLFRTRFLPSRYCTRCGWELKRRKCAYASRPAEEIICTNPSCAVHYVQTAYEIVRLDDE
jgi:hypothetical protein